MVNMRDRSSATNEESSLLVGWVN